MYRGFTYISNYSGTRDVWYSEAWKEGSEYLYGSGSTEKESIEDIKKNISEYLDLYGE
jgi:hypothetical protein